MFSGGVRGRRVEGEVVKREAPGKRAGSLFLHRDVGGKELAGGGGGNRERGLRIWVKRSPSYPLSKRFPPSEGTLGDHSVRNKMRNRKPGVKGLIILSMNFRVASLHSAINQSDLEQFT